jgi:hypothetical protein
VALRPAQVHPDEHLRPIRGLRAADAGDHVQDRAVLVVFTGEQESGALALEGATQRVGLAIQLRGEVRVVVLREQIEDRDQIRGARFEVAPRGDLGAEAVSLAKDLLGGALVVPESWFLRLRVQARECGFLGG